MRISPPPETSPENGSESTSGQVRKKNPGREFTLEESRRGGKARAKQVAKQKEELARFKQRAARRTGKMTIEQISRDIQDNPEDFDFATPSAIPTRALLQQAEARKYPPGTWDDDKRVWRHRKQEIETQTIEGDENGESLDALPE